MSEKTIGQTPESAIKVTTSASLPEARKLKPEAETDIKFVMLNNIDQRYAGYPDEIIEALANNMSAKGISAEQILSAL